jgi:peroxiredoxin
VPIAAIEKGISMVRILLYGLGALVLIVGGAAAYLIGPAFFPLKSINVGIAMNAPAPITMPLVDSSGAPTSLQAKMGPKGTVLVMVRSADWCPFCKAQLSSTNAIAGSVSKLGYTLVSVSYDSPDKLAGFAKDKGINYAMLSDPGSKMIDALGLRDPAYPVGNFAYGVPRPTILVVGADGLVKAKYVTDDYRRRPSNDDVMALINGVKS